MADKEHGLLGLSEIAYEIGYGCTRFVVTNWHARGKLPEPAEILAAGPVWRRAQVTEFVKTQQARLRRERDVKMIAGIIAENDVTPDQAREINAADGWTFDTEGTTDRDWARHEGVQLQDEDLERAIKLARAWVERAAQPAPAPRG